MGSRLLATNRGSANDVERARAQPLLMQIGPFVVASVCMTIAVLANGLALSRPEPERDAETSACRTVLIARSTPVDGVGHLCSNGNGIQPRMTVHNLNPGTAYTSWFVYFDQPSTCIRKPCGMPDMASLDPLAITARMDGLIASDDGLAMLRADFRGVRLSAGSHVSLMLVSHGPPAEMNNRSRARQLLVSDPYWLKGLHGGPVTDDDAGIVVAVAVFTDD